MYEVRKIRHLKEKVRVTTSEFPFVWIPILVLIQTVYNCGFWINTFPNCSENFWFSPHEIVTELSTDYERDCKVNVGSYVEASTETIMTNDNTEPASSCVAVGPVGNRQGSVKCFDIETGKILHRRTVTQLPWPLDNRLVKKIEEWGKKGAAAIKRGCITF